MGYSTYHLIDKLLSSEKKSKKLKINHCNFFTLLNKVLIFEHIYTHSLNSR